MIVFRQKEFGIATINSFEEFITGQDGKFITQGPLNIMKSIEMLYLEDGEFIEHWLGEMVWFETMKKLVKFGSAPQIIFIGLEEDPNIIRDIIGANNAELFIERFRSPEDYISVVKNRLLTETKKGIGFNSLSSMPKYNNWFKDNPITTTDGEYVIFLKYIALSISGQINPFVDNIRDNYVFDKVVNMKINFEKKNTKLLSGSVSKSGKYPKNLISVIIKCIENINYGCLSSKASDLL